MKRLVGSGLNTFGTFNNIKIDDEDKVVMTVGGELVLIFAETKYSLGSDGKFVQTQNGDITEDRFFATIDELDGFIDKLEMYRIMMSDLNEAITRTTNLEPMAEDAR